MTAAPAGQGRRAASGTIAGRTDLVVFVTPRIIYPDHPANIDAIQKSNRMLEDFEKTIGTDILTEQEHVQCRSRGTPKRATESPLPAQRMRDRAG